MLEINNNPSYTELKEEYHQLINLAEDVSSNYNALKEKRDSFRAKAIITGGAIIICVMFFISLGFKNIQSDISSNLEVLFLVVLIASAPTLVLYFFRSYAKTTKELAAERAILSELLTIIDESKKNINNELTSLDQAYFDMRLSRIRFSS